MKILHISMYSWQAGGLSKVVFDHTGKQAQSNEVEIWSVLSPNESVYDVPPMVKLRTFKANYLSRFLPFFSISFFQALKKEIADFDIIHIHGIFHFGAIAPFWIKNSGSKIISIHGMLDKWALRVGKLKKQLFSNIIQKRILKKSHVIHVEQEQEWQDTKAYLNGYDQNLFLLPNSIDINLYKNLPPKEHFKIKYNIPADKKIIFFISRLNSKKGLDLLLPAFKKYQQDNNDTYLILAGPDDGYEEAINEYIVQYKLADCIILTGMLTGDEKMGAFNDADVFVLPTYSEGFSIAVLEAIATEVPIVVSNFTGFSEEIKQWNAGEIVALDSESVYEGIKKVLNDKAYANTLKTNALAMVEAQYDLDTNTQKMINVYTKQH